MTDLEGLVAVVTGGASGIGAATARLLHDRGARVAVLDRDITGAAADLHPIRCDVAEQPLVAGLSP
jgi:NAD(P)-dependent dehydrogenase (short-subunit alcohol dehydrogenase family)